jgi:hypothetical protein
MKTRRSPEHFLEGGAIMKREEERVAPFGCGLSSGLRQSLGIAFASGLQDLWYNIGTGRLIGKWDSCPVGAAKSIETQLRF